MAPSESIITTGVVVPHLGGPEVLAVRPWEVPAPAPHEVRIRVEAAGISFADLLVIQGVHPERRTPPFVPGWDVVGEAESVGSHVSHVAPGDRVAGLSIVGGWAEQAIVPGYRAVRIPESVEATAAVCLVMDYIVAYQMLTRSARVQAGDAVLIQGAGGGVGTAFMQVARTLDLRVFGTDRASKRAHIEAAGATLIDFENEDVVERCRQLTGGRGVEAAFDGIGATAPTSLRAVRRGGTLVWFGMTTMLTHGQRGLRNFVQTTGRVMSVFASNVMPQGKRTTFYSIQALAKKHPQWYQEDLTTLLDMLVGDQISPHVAAVWKLDETPTAVEGLARGALPGKQVIAVSNR